MGNLSGVSFNWRFPQFNLFSLFFLDIPSKGRTSFSEKVITYVNITADFQGVLSKHLLKGGFFPSFLF